MELLAVIEPLMSQLTSTADEVMQFLQQLGLDVDLRMVVDELGKLENLPNMMQSTETAPTI